MMKKIKAHDFQKFKTTGFFGRDIWNGIITLELRLEKQANFEKKKVILKILLDQNTKIKRKEKHYLIKTQVK